MATSGLTSACAHLPELPGLELPKWQLGASEEPAAGAEAPRIADEVYRRAERERAERLEREIELLRADLRRAEEALVAAESGVRHRYSRAEAVSSLAAVRIQLERAGKNAPWRIDEITEGRAKLDEADRLIGEGHYGAAVFFTSRAGRIVRLLESEAEAVGSNPDTRVVRVERVNLRAGPSTSSPVLTTLAEGAPVFLERESAEWALVRTPHGPGWVHRSLLAQPAPPASP